LGHSSLGLQDKRLSGATERLPTCGNIASRLKAVRGKQMVVTSTPKLTRPFRSLSGSGRPLRQLRIVTMSKLKQ
jgi:hypothetical protein